MIFFFFKNNIQELEFLVYFFKFNYKIFFTSEIIDQYILIVNYFTRKLYIININILIAEYSFFKKKSFFKNFLKIIIRYNF